MMLALVCVLFACGGEGSSGTAAESPAAVSDAGYTLEPVPGSDLMLAVKYDADGIMQEKGFFLNNLPEGTWYYYEHLRTKEFPKRIATYHQGVLNGPYLELSESGTVVLQAYYLNNELTGYWGSYKFGRPLKTADYKQGILDGVYREYVPSTGKLQKEIHYKNGKEDGPYRFFNNDGEVTLEYTYKDGEKISGGMIDSEKPNPPR
jgi:antitoxin component YwqK of YwqJK toxin-antitoxin module